MNKSIYSKLGKQNLWNNRELYFPYMMASIVTIAMYYMMESIRVNAGLEAMPKTAQLKEILWLGTAVVGIFSVIFLLYTNRFIIRRRTKEIGIYNILGMEKKHIGRMMLIEVMMISIVSMLGGILVGIVFSKLMYLVLLKILAFEVGFKYVFSWAPILYTIRLFVGIFGATLMINLIRIKVSKPIELLKGGQVGEKEPKSKWLLALSGLVALGIGYSIAIVIKSPLMAINFFFLAVIFVMYGTYALFTAASILVLKILKKNKKFYYQAKHFTSVSSLIYRMKQNAVGLANICILSTAVLIMLSSTVALYIGNEDALNVHFPYDISVSGFGISEEMEEKIYSIIQEASMHTGAEIEDLQSLRSNFLLMVEKDNELKSFEDSGMPPAGVASVLILTVDQFNQLENKAYTLEGDKIFLFSSEKDMEQLIFEGKVLRVSKEEVDFDYIDKQPQIISKYYYIVVKDLDQVKELVALGSGEPFAHEDLEFSFNVASNTEIEKAFIDEIRKEINGLGIEKLGVRARENEKETFLAIAGGLLFLGIFLGVLFLVATALIIYYKQVSEGYDDRERFIIMQKVGMSHEEVKKSIGDQIRLVFFLPIVTAFIHVLVAFKMISRLLGILGFTNEPLYLLCTIGIFAVFGLVYGCVYKYTARVYYRIVSG